MIIKIVNPVYAKAEKKDIGILKEILSCPAMTWKNVYDPKQKRIRKKEVTYLKYFIDKEGFFLIGFLDRVIDYLRKSDIELTIINEVNWIDNVRLIEPKGITLREDQKTIVEKALLERNGIIKSPTGSGKTILAAALITSCKVKTVFLCHTLTLAHQAKSDFKNVGLEATLYTGSEKNISNLTISTIQSFSKLSIQDLMRWEMVIVDEAHHCSSLDTLYGKTLRMVPSYFKFGLTATVPSDVNKEHFMTMEGLLGSVIGELTLQEGIEKGILAKPKVKILQAPENKLVKDLRKYQDVYEMAVVRSYGRNNLIMNYVKKLADEEKTSLILVSKIIHGQILERIGQRLGLKIQFIQGKDDSIIRENLREILQTKEIDCVIATTIWREGVNIPSLDAIINASGGKSEIATLQGIGRGLRTTGDKKEVLLVDIFDNNHYYLLNHFGLRFCLYQEMEWI
jgi:superfamily II DNA or RNA helicase